jgi:putative DNA primase/helicase
LNQGQKHHDTLPALRTLQALPQWVCWRKEPREDGKGWTKVPYNPRTQKRAKSNDPRTWASYAIALQVYQQSKRTPHPYDGLSFAFRAGGNLTGVDLDHCIAEDGTLDAWARRWIEQLASYTERSPSDEGVHAFVIGTHAKPRCDKLIIKGERHESAAIEIYSEVRFFTVTGKHLAGTPTTIEARQEALDALYQELASTRGENVNRNEARNEKVLRFPTTPDDDTLIKKAEAASNGDKFRALFRDGSTAGYGSPSEADMALCLLLAFWTGRDPDRMDRLFRQSALYRDKWDTARSTSTYGWETIHRAASRCNVVYDPTRPMRQLERDIEQVLAQVAHQQAKAQGTRKRKPHQLTPKEVETARVLSYLDENEYGDARFFAEVFADQVCYDHTDKEWYLWDGHYWKRDETGKVRQLVAGVLGTLYLRAAADLNTTYAGVELEIQTLERSEEKGNEDKLRDLKARAKLLAGQMEVLSTRAKGLRSAKRMNNVQTFIQAEMGITSGMWDTHPWLLPVQNGVIDLHTGTCHDGIPSDYLRTVAPTEWMGLDTLCPRFEQFLQEIFADKEDRDELIAFLQRLMGYGITGLTSLHLFPILYGAEGRNGKDTLLAVIKAVLGALVGPVSNDVFIAQDRLRAGGAATPHLCDLQGKRLVWGSETKEGDRLNIAQIKLLTGGGDIPARQLHGKQYSFTPTHKLLLMTNYKPHAEARDKAFWTRACLIEFGLRFVTDPHASNERQADPTLKETLLQERSGILAWLVRGCLQWQREGIALPESIQLATDKYREEEDKLLQFVQECCIVAPRVHVKAGQLFSAYKLWCEENQFGKGMNGKLFGDEMSKRFSKTITREGRIYEGIGLLAQGIDQDQPSQQAMMREKRDGSVMGQNAPITPTQATSEASSAHDADLGCDGCDGCCQVFSQNEKKVPPIGEKHGGTHHTHHSKQPSVTPNSSSEAASTHVMGQKGCITDPSPECEQKVESMKGSSPQEPASEAEPEYVMGQRVHTTDAPPKYVDTVDRLGITTGRVLEDGRIGVWIVSDGVERFYWPKMTFDPKPDEIQAYEARQQEGKEHA